MISPMPEIIPYGDSAFLLEFKTDRFSREICETVQGLQRHFLQDGTWIEAVPGYDSLLLKFNPMAIDPIAAQDRVSQVLNSFKTKSLDPGSIIEIPVHYGGENGPDMSVIMEASGLSEAEIIERHSAIDYLVCMMGFIPGFTFLSETDPLLHHPRRTTPREAVPAGSVGIAGWQTGMYGLESPGGWQIIGRTPLVLFDKSRSEPFLLKAGDHIRFVPFEARS